MKHHAYSLDQRTTPLTISRKFIWLVYLFLGLLIDTVHHAKACFMMYCRDREGIFSSLLWTFRLLTTLLWILLCTIYSGLIRLFSMKHIQGHLMLKGNMEFSHGDQSTIMIILSLNVILSRSYRIGSDPLVINIYNITLNNWFIVYILLQAKFVIVRSNKKLKRNERRLDIQIYAQSYIYYLYYKPRYI
ncbi:hypothetical protein ACJX0J_014885, partial [Zea mays]